MKGVLTRSDIEGKRGKWIEMIEEDDMDMKPTKLVKGQGLENILIETNFQAMGINLLVEVEENNGTVEKGKSIDPDNKVQYK